MTTPADAISLPFVEAIRYFTDKVPTTSTHWTDVWQAANARAFTVAGATTEALVEDFRAEIRKALEEGTTLADFRRGFDEIVARRGWSHTGEPGWRSRIIYETNLSTAYSAGRYHQQTRAETLAHFPYWEYVHSGALNPREQHLGWDGLVLRADDSFWATHYPPNGWRCGCWVRVVSARGLAERGRAGPDASPDVDYYEWTNPRTGEVHQVPAGIDPSFDYSPGRAWIGSAPDIPSDARLPVPPIPAPSPARVQDYASRALAGDPLPEGPHVAVARLPDELAGRLGVTTRLAYLSAETIRSHRHHATTTAETYAFVAPRLIAHGEVTRDRRSELQLRLFGVVDGVLWGATLKATANRTDAYLTSLHRSHRRQRERHRAAGIVRETEED